MTQMEKHTPYSLMICKTESYHSTCDDKEHKSNVKINLIGNIVKLFSTSFVKLRICLIIEEAKVASPVRICVSALQIAYFLVLSQHLMMLHFIGRQFKLK